ncbi:MAG: hypothetical protein AAGH92_06965 [Planctomycetota bacterium]
MPCYLDQAELTADAANLTTPATLGKWLDAARKRAGDAGRVVVEVRLNDALIGHEQLDEQLASTVAADDDLQLASADPAELGIDALQQSRTQLAELGELQQQAADKLQADRAGEALNLVGDAVQHWINVANAVTQVARLTELDLDTLELTSPQGDESAAAVIAGLSGSLTELRELIQAGDTTTLADALGYEWPALIDRWDAMLGAMSERLSA